MIDLIKECMKKCGIETWKIVAQHVSSHELFFIRKDMDMNRTKDVQFFEVTVYSDFNSDGTDYRGSASIRLPVHMAESEIVKKLEQASFSASFIKNPFFPLVQPGPATFKALKSDFARDDIQAVLGQIIDSLYKNDIYEEGGINSAEIFVNRHFYRIQNSEGVDVCFNRYQGEIELVCDWNSGPESVELYNMFSFSDLSPELIERECTAQIENCRFRSEAQAAPDLQSIQVILGIDAVKKLLAFYQSQSNVQGVYEGIARAVPGEIFQGEDVRGDLINILLNPELENSPYSVPYDLDGVPLKKTELYKDGKLLCYNGSQQFSHYMKTPATGNIRNMMVQCGEQSVEEWKKNPHVQILAFSDFQMDGMTGDFGGEIRLALYYDGEKTVPVTGATLSACIFDVQNEMYLSRERTQKENYDGPAYLLIPKADLGGSRGNV